MIFEQLLRDVIKIARRDPFNLDAMCMKVAEETGELNEAINHFQGRTPHKKMKEPPEGEVADVIISAISVLVKTYPSSTDDQLVTFVLDGLLTKGMRYADVVNVRLDLLNQEE